MCLQIIDQNIAVTSCGLEALMSLKTSCTNKAPANKTITRYGIVFFEAAASLSLCTAVSQS